MEFESYQQFWDNQAVTPESALAAVDGSSDETIVQRTGRFAAAQVMAALDLQPQDHVLDLGCGVGRVGRELAGQCSHWTGVDISRRMLDHAESRLSHLDNVSLHQLNRTDLQMIPDASIDKAYSVAVLCHMDKEDMFLYLQELCRVVKPGGTIFVDTWNLAHPVGWKRWQYEVRFWQNSEQNQRKDVARNQFCAPEEFQLYIERAGFQSIACFSNSPWIQAVAGKQLDRKQLKQEQKRVGKAQADIAYSPLFSELFDQTVDIIYGQLHPRDAIAFLDEHVGGDEETLYRPFILGLWKSNTAQWGDVPA
jgi:ubiquinone/menaquinone biosynthesis C-methylase UbiE